MTLDRDQLLRDALDRIEELEDQVRRQHEPVAVVGWGLRAPGADDPDALWQRLCEGTGSVGPLGDDRFVHPPEVVDSAGWIGHLREFDAEFFGISAHEAASIDPQQRLLLEVTWEALESAGIPGRQVPERTGVFVGVSNIDYREAMVLAGDPDRFFSAGNTPSTVSGRLAYFFGTRGPALSVDTACSSSLVAVDLAVRHLRDGSCDVALAGGVNRIVTPHESLSLTRAAMLSASGTCHPFSAAADGYVRGEGGGVVVLKRLADVGEHDRVLGLLLGSATNQDGRSSGLTVPHGPSQQAVVRAALRDADVAPDEVGYVEAHGTGTRVGDLIEIRALSSVFSGRPSPLLVGSVKSSLGHLEASAGVMGLVKALQVVRHGVVPGTLHHEPPLDDVDWVDGPVRVPTRTEAWPTAGPRVAGVSSFGFSGTNAHVVVVAPPDPAPSSAEVRPEQPLVLPVSAREPRALTELGERWADALLARPEQAAALCATAALGRTHFPLRRCVVAPGPTALAAALRLRERDAVDRAKPHPRVAFLFTGQGAQVPGMAAELHRTVPVFRDAVEESLAMAGEAADDLRRVLLTPDDRVHETAYTQPALFVMEHALARVWQSWGVEPDVVVGHSVGEYVAACLAGVMTPEATLRLLVLRGRLMQACPPGVMYAVGVGGPEAWSLLDRVAALPSSAVAALNTPTGSVLSGREDELAEVLQELRNQGVPCRRLQVSHAFHSPLLRPMVEEFAEACARVPTDVPTIPLLSNVTGTVHEGAIAAEYWVRHALEPVLFQRCLETTRDLGVDLLLEIGPAPVLLGMAGEVCPSLRRVPSLARGRLDLTSLVQGLAGLYEAGVDLDWSAVLGAGRARTTDAPTYPFQRREHWAVSSRIDAGRSCAWQDRPGPTLLTLVGADAPLPETGASGSGVTVVGGAADEVASGLRRAGLRVETVEAGEAGEVRPALADDRGLWLALPDDGSVSAAVSATAEVVRVVQGMVSSSGSGSGRAPLRRLVVAVLGPGAAAATPAERAVEALLRTAAAEHDDLRCAVLGWAAGSTPDLGAEVVAEPTGWVSLVRLGAAGTRTTHVLERGLNLPGPATASGGVVVTGGTGALGGAVVEALVAAGHPRVVLLARHEPDGAAARSLAGLRAAGHDLRLVLGDVTDPAAVAEAIAAASDQLSLGGVVHAAGTDHVARLRTLDTAALERTAVKARGAEVLDQALDAFPDAPLVAFSSLAALLPTRSQGAYAAANAALEAVVAARRAAGRPGVAVAWGPWAGAGMAAGEDALHASTGLRMLEPGAAARATVAILHGAASLPAVVAYADADWATVRSSVAPVGDLVLGGLGQPGASSPDDQASPREAAPVPEADRTPRPRDPAELLAYVERAVHSLLGSATAVDVDTGFFDLGFDSLLVVELRASLERTLGVALPATVAFRHPTPRDLVDHLVGELGLVGGERPTEPGQGYAEVPPPEESPAQLDDVLARIDARFDELDQPR